MAEPGFELQSHAAVSWVPVLDTRNTGWKSPFGTNQGSSKFTALPQYLFTQYLGTEAYWG